MEFTYRAAHRGVELLRPMQDNLLKAGKSQN